MKKSKLLSVLVAFIVLLNIFNVNVFAIGSEELVDDNTGFTDSPVLNEREDTELDRRTQTKPTIIKKKEDKEFVKGRMVDGLFVHEENFKSNSYLKGNSARMETTFSVGEWKVNEVELTLVYSASQFIDNTKSSFTVLINGVRCISEAQPSTYGERSQMKFTLPSSELKLGVNTLAIEADILTVGDAPGTVGSIESGWFNVFEDSTIALSYEPLNMVTSIAEFYEKFKSMESLDFKESAIVSVKEANQEELKNAMLVMSGISKNTTIDSQNIAFATVENLADTLNYDHVIFVADYQNLPVDLKDYLSDEQKSQAEQSALIALIKTESQDILVVSGKNEVALSNAARLLANADMMAQMDYESRLVGESEDYELAPEVFEQYRQLTKTGTLLQGEAIQSSNYYIEFPYNRSITDKSQLYLSFRYADNLDFERSLMSVYLNDIPIASKRLSQSNAAQDEVTFYIPTDIAVSGNFVLRVDFDLRTNNSGGAAPWAFVSPESTLKINSVSQPFLVFENYPSPFIKDENFNELLVVLPEKPTEADYTVLAQTFNLFGQYMEQVSGNLSVVFANEVFDITNKNVITIGVQSTNQYTQSLNEKLFFQFSEDGSKLLSNEKMLIDSTFSQNLGTIQLLESPSSKDHAILVMSGTSEKGFLKAASYLKTADYAWKVFGDGFVSDMEEIFNFKFKADNAQTLSIPSKLRVREDLTSLIIVLSMLGLMIILSFIFMLFRYRKGGSQNEKK